MYLVLKGKLGKRFISFFAKEKRFVRDHQSNSEHPLVLVTVILWRTAGVFGFKAIRKHLIKRMDCWDQG